MKLKSCDIVSILSLFFITTVLGDELHGEHAKQENGQQKRDPMTLIKDSQHIKEHLRSEYGFSEQQADDYLKKYDAQTQFFVMHDYDNNTKLDGLELLKSMTHHHEEGSHDDDEHSTEDQTDTLVEFVDMVMKDQDLNDDGFIDYPEYINYYTKFDRGNGDSPATSP